jgi:replicative DNA helicase
MKKFFEEINKKQLAGNRILAGIFLDNKNIKMARKKIKPKHFVTGRSKDIYKAMLILCKKEKEIDLVSVAEFLDGCKSFKSGVAVYLAKLIDQDFSEFNLKKEIKILKG